MRRQRVHSVRNGGRASKRSEARAVAVLKELRECPLHLASPVNPEPDQAAIAEWAANHWLNSAPVIAAAIDLRLFWSMNPHHASKLQIGGSTVIVVTRRSGEEQAWIDRQVMETTLPQPTSETLQGYLKRATGYIWSVNNSSANVPDLAGVSF